MVQSLFQPVSEYVDHQGNHLHVSTWGEAENPAIVMWHGLARTGRDFDEAAQYFARDHFVICPDTLGRGLSSWARDVAVDYSYAAYGQHALAILDHFNVTSVKWVGTSMGGLLGVHLASGPLKERMTHLVVNDIGPWIPETATGRIADYVGNPPEFSSVTEIEEWLRTNYEPFGENTDHFWRRMANTSCRRNDAGKMTVHYDPKIVTQFTLHKSDLDCWPQWDEVQTDTLLLRGERSDVLPVDIALEMTRRGPKADLVELAGFGHAPTLASQTELAVLRDFLN